MKVNQVVPLGFGVVFGLMAITTVTTQQGVNNFTEASKIVARTYKVEAQLKALEKSLVDAETGQRGFLYTEDSDFLEPYNQTKNQLDALLSTLKDDLKNNSEQLERLKDVETLIAEKFQELNETISLKQAGKVKEARAVVLSKKGKQIMDQIRERLAEMIQIEEQLLGERQNQVLQVQKTSLLLAWGSTAFAIVCGSMISWIISRVIMKPINDAALAIASSATEIACTVEEQERIASEQASFVTQTTTTMEELNASAAQAAQQAEAATAAARQVAHLVVCLSDQTRQIGSITHAVGELASQTNMLALNAAVEAVRAGHNGKGFSVVAGEIRRLAEQSKKSAQNITTLINEIQKLTDSQGIVAEEIRKFESIVPAVNHIVISSQQISLTAKQQAVAIQQVVAAMSAIKAGATQTASGISQTKIGTQKLNEAAQHLKSLGV